VDPKNDRYIHAFHSLQQLRNNPSLSSNGLTRDSFKNKFILSFELLSQNIENSYAAKNKGQIVLQLDFSETVADSRDFYIRRNFKDS